MSKPQVIHQLERDLTSAVKKLDRECITIWLMQFSSHKPLKLEHPTIGKISYEGIAFKGSPSLVFDQYVSLCIEDLIQHFLKRVEKSLHDAPLYQLKTIVTLASGLILSARMKLLNRAANIKGRLLGDGVNFSPVRIRSGEEIAVEAYLTGCGIAINRKRLEEGIVVFEEVANDRITHVKGDGTIIKKEIPAVCGKGKITLMDGDLPLESGDHLLRKRPGGIVDDFIVIDPGYSPGMLNIKPFFAAEVRRSDVPSASPEIVINNIHGDNARVNVNSTDNSQNTVHRNSNELFYEIIEVLKTQVENLNDQKLMIDCVEEMRKAQTKEGFLAKYQEFVNLGAQHMAIISPFIPALTALL